VTSLLATLAKGKWFAAAKDSRFIDLANRSPSDPRTLIRATSQYAAERPEFALEAKMTALLGIANGWGLRIIGVDVPDAYAAILASASAGGADEKVVKADMRALIAASRNGGEVVEKVLGHQLAG
jgi:hypothetical protein